MTVRSRRFARNALLTTSAGLAIGIPCLWPDAVDLRAQEAATVRGQSETTESKNPLKRLFGGLRKSDTQTASAPQAEQVEQVEVIPQSVQITGDEANIITKLFGEEAEEPEPPSRRDLRRQARYAKKHPYAARIAAQRKRQEAEAAEAAAEQETYEEVERLAGGYSAEEIPSWEAETIDLTPHNEVAPPVVWPDAEPGLSPAPAPAAQPAATVAAPAADADPFAADDPFPAEEADQPAAVAAPPASEAPAAAPSGSDDLLIPFPDDAATPTEEAEMPAAPAPLVTPDEPEAYIPPEPEAPVTPEEPDEVENPAPAPSAFNDIRTADAPAIAPPPPAETATPEPAPLPRTPGVTVPSGLGGPLMVRSQKSSTVVEPPAVQPVQPIVPPAPAPMVSEVPSAPVIVESFTTPSPSVPYIPPAPEDFGDPSLAESNEIPDLFPMKAAPPAPVMPSEAPSGSRATAQAETEPEPVQPSDEPVATASTSVGEPSPLVAPSTARRIESPALQKAPSDTASKLERIASRKGIAGLKGFCPVALRDDRNLLDARPEYSTVFNGRRYYFSSETALATFETTPEQYAPAASGHDVVHMALTGEEQQGSLDHAVWFRGKLYLFSSVETLETFVSAPSIHAAE